MFKVELSTQDYKTISYFINRVINEEVGQRLRPAYVNFEICMGQTVFNLASKSMHLVLWKIF